MLLRKYVVFVLALSLLAVSGCAMKSMREQRAEAQKRYNTIRFDVGAVSLVTIASSKDMEIDGRTWNWSELLASVCQDSIKERNLSVGQTAPSVGGPGGAYLTDEMKLSGRRHMLNLSWYKNGMLSLIMYLRDENGNLPYSSKEDVKKNALIQRQLFLGKTHYADDEAFYEGLKTELRPVIDSLFDEAFGNIRKVGVTDI